MSNRIVVAGSTGNLGKRIVKALIEREATVVALVRSAARGENVSELKALGVTVELIDETKVDALARACSGADCVLSAMAGLRDVIVDAQELLVQAAVIAGVPRFISSDFCTDFTQLPAGENRNFDLRRDFRDILNGFPIEATSIFNGAFAEVLNYNIPVLDSKNASVGYWDDSNHILDFTTMDDTAAYTAAAALDPMTPRDLRIASFQVTPNTLVRVASDIHNKTYQLIRMGTLEELRGQNKAARAANPQGENELYASWQQGQYVQSMFSTQHESLDNARYPDLKWTGIEQLLRSSL